MSPSTFDSRIGPKLEMVARTGTPIPDGAQRQELDRERRRRPVVAGVLGALRGLVVRLAGPRQPGQVALDVGHHHRNAGGGQLLGDHLQRLRLAGAGGARDQAVAVDGGQRDAHLRGRIDGAVDDDGAQFQRLTFDGVTGGDLLGGGGCRLGRHGSNITAANTAAVGVAAPVDRRGPTVIAVRDELVWIDCEMTGLDLTSDRLIEIAVLVTDADLNILGDGIDVVIHADDAALSAMIDVVTQMHTRSGLTEEVRASTIDVAAAEEHGARLHPHATSSRPRPPRWPATRSPPTAASSPATCPRSTTTCTTG